MSQSSHKAKKRFCLVLVKPSHYDDDGYVLQWLRSPVPSNSLATIYGLAEDCARRKVLGEEVEIEIHPIDETHTRVRPERIAAMIEKAEAGGMVMLVGVQSNQFPRSLDIARPLRKRGIQVAVGGFHVSGTLAMLKERDADVRIAEEMGVSLFAGEAEGRLERVLQDAAQNKLEPLYNYMDDLPNLDGAVTPLLPAEIVKRAFGNTSFDAGRGCPFSCSFCTIINVQGRKSRSRTADDVEGIIRANLAQGIHSFVITDDNFARNKNWEPIFDRLIHLREVEKLNIKFSIQIDTGCHRIPNFIEKARRAGVKRVFIGLENINPKNLVGARKNQNKITEYRQMLIDWKRAGVMIFCGYIIGFPNDTRESILNDVRIIQRELPIDIMEYTCLTPLPGSQDHREMYEAGLPMDADLNKYDVNHVTIPHPLMSREEWESAYADVWTNYYSDEHIETILKRCAATGTSPSKTMSNLVWFRGSVQIEKAHPVEGGFFRRKFRRDRRPTLPMESIWAFYPKYFAETLLKQIRWVSLFLSCYRILKRVRADERAAEYTDIAITPVAEEKLENMEMFQSAEAQAYLNKIRRVEEHRQGAASTR
ncbi:MAG: radical SAM protein [Acidobacteriota bacterium]|nr:radical SAM protein [Acidobacteriota bacterium]